MIPLSDDNNGKVNAHWTNHTHYDPQRHQPPPVDEVSTIHSERVNGLETIVGDFASESADGKPIEEVKSNAISSAVDFSNLFSLATISPRANEVETPLRRSTRPRKSTANYLLAFSPAATPTQGSTRKGKRRKTTETPSGSDVEMEIRRIQPELNNGLEVHDASNDESTPQGSKFSRVLGSLSPVSNKVLSQLVTPERERNDIFAPSVPTLASQLMQLQLPPTTPSRTPGPQRIMHTPMASATASSPTKVVLAPSIRDDPSKTPARRIAATSDLFASNTGPSPRKDDHALILNPSKSGDPARRIPDKPGAASFVSLHMRFDSPLAAKFPSRSQSAEPPPRKWSAPEVSRSASVEPRNIISSRPGGQHSTHLPYPIVSRHESIIKDIANAREEAKERPEGSIKGASNNSTLKQPTTRIPRMGGKPYSRPVTTIPASREIKPPPKPALVATQPKKVSQHTSTPVSIVVSVHEINYVRVTKFFLWTLKRQAGSFKNKLSSTSSAVSKGPPTNAIATILKRKRDPSPQPLRQSSPSRLRPVVIIRSATGLPSKAARPIPSTTSIPKSNSNTLPNPSTTQKLIVKARAAPGKKPHFEPKSTATQPSPPINASLTRSALPIAIPSSATPSPMSLNQPSTSLQIPSKVFSPQPVIKTSTSSTTRISEQSLPGVLAEVNRSSASRKLIHEPETVSDTKLAVDRSTTPPCDDEPEPDPGKDIAPTRRTTRPRKAALSPPMLDILTTGRRRSTQPRNAEPGFGGLSAVALKTMTSTNTTRNQQYLTAMIEIEIIKRHGTRPETPAMKVKTIAERQEDEKERQKKERAKRRARRGGDVGEDTEADVTTDSGSVEPDASFSNITTELEMGSDSEGWAGGFRKGAGDEDDYQISLEDTSSGDTEALGKAKRGVHWDRGLYKSIYLDEIILGTRQPLMEFPPDTKECLAPHCKVCIMHPVRLPITLLNEFVSSLFSWIRTAIQLPQMS